MVLGFTLMFPTSALAENPQSEKGDCTQTLNALLQRYGILEDDLEAILKEYIQIL